MHRLKFRGKPRDFLDCYQKYGVVSVNLDSFCRDRLCRVRRFQKRENHRAGTERTGVVRFVRLLQLSAAGEVFLEGTCPLSRCPQTAKFPAPSLLGAGRRWVRKATAFRGRSEQDRSALYPACCTLILKTFRWNVFNETYDTQTKRDTAHRIPHNILSIFLRASHAASPNPIH